MISCDNSIYSLLTHQANTQCQHCRNWPPRNSGLSVTMMLPFQENSVSVTKYPNHFYKFVQYSILPQVTLPLGTFQPSEVSTTKKQAKLHAALNCLVGIGALPAEEVKSILESQA